MLYRATLAILSSSLLWAVSSGCSSDDNSSLDENNAVTNQGTSSNNDSNGASNNGASNNGASNNGASNNGASNNGSSNNGSSNNTNATGSDDCEAVAANFATKGSANPSLPDPVVNATCDGDTVTVTANGIPDFTYIQTSPGDPREQDIMISFPANPTFAADPTDIPLLGPMAITTNGIPIYGPTEGAGGDVLALGNLSDCGTHNGPTGFHMHMFGTSTTTDCIYAPEEVLAAPRLLGYAYDGFPIYTGNDQYTSSWVLTDETVFASDTWAAHSYVEGSGDLDECNGRVDDDGNYAYYTTHTFPYIMGCLAGEVTLESPERP